MLLTKRPERLLELDKMATHPDIARMIRSPRVWIGVSVEDQATAAARIPLLLQIPTSNRWVSVEPELAHVDLSEWLKIHREPASGRWVDGPGTVGIGWVVCGCESGRRRRPFDKEWACSLRDQCAAAVVPFFYKQAPDLQGRIDLLPTLDGRCHREIPEMVRECMR